MGRSLITSPQALTKKVFFISHQLGLYQAELARVLHVHCADIGRLGSGRAWLEAGTLAWRQACLLVDFYQHLFEKLQGDEVSMYHWLRAENPLLAGVPLLLIIDDDRLGELVSRLETDVVIRRVTKFRTLTRQGDNKNTQ